VPLLIAKLLLTPLLIGVASLVARRWGPAVGGLLVALPLTSGPVAFFLAIDPGPAFAVAAMSGALAGLVAICGFAAGYAAVGPRRGPWAGFAAASAAFVVVGVALQPVVGAPAWVLAALAVGAAAVVLRFLPVVEGRRAPRRPPPWDLPGRMVVGTAIVVLVTGAAVALGPRLSGLAATFPVYVAVLAVFGQLHEGPAAAIDVLRGLLAGLPGTAAFYLVVAAGLERLGIPATFGLAVVVALALDAVALRWVRVTSQGPVEPEPA
jgi:hypothetical protein